MANMAAIVQTINAISYSFLLAESDIAVLTYEQQTGADSVRPGIDSNFYDYRSLIKAVGGKVNDYIPDGYSFKARSIFEPFAQTIYPRLSGKPLLSFVATEIEQSNSPFNLETAAVLAMALKGGGLPLNVAGGTADTLVRNSPSASGKFNLVQSILVPQILRAAAAA
jgi:hypothetical protein